MAELPRGIYTPIPFDALEKNKNYFVKSGDEYYELIFNEMINNGREMRVDFLPPYPPGRMHGDNTIIPVKQENQLYFLSLVGGRRRRNKSKSRSRRKNRRTRRRV